MNEIEALENCRDPAEAKRLLAAWLARKLREDGHDCRDVCLLLAEGIETGRLVFRKRRNRVPGESYVKAALRDPVWWAERIIKIKEKA
jgi:hypothetical protein